MGTDALHDSFETSRRLGFHRLPDEPIRGKRSAAYERAMNNFMQAILRGLVPAPDIKRGRKNLWRTSTIDACVASGQQAKKPRTKKAEVCANRPQPKTAPAKKQVNRKIANPSRRVNGNVGAR